MRYLFFLCFLLLAWRAAGDEVHFSFGDMGADGSLTNFQAELLGGGGPVAWKLLPGEAPSAFPSLTDPSKTVSGGGSVLAQTSQDPTDERFPMFIYDGEKFRNFRLTTQFKLVSGVAEQMAGLVFRFQNISNFYVARVSGLGKNLRFYKVVDGNRPAPVGVPCEVTAGTWHQLAVQCDGNHISIFLDGQQAIPTLGDTTFAEGKIGFWTKSDAVTYFANAGITYTPIVPPAQVAVESVLRQQPRIIELRICGLTSNNAAVVVASKDPTERGEPGSESELGASRGGSAYFGRDQGTVVVVLPLHDRNGEVIGSTRFKLKSFLGETQNNALGRAALLMKIVEGFGMSAEDLAK
jgi:hypothetical protein